MSILKLPQLVELGTQKLEDPRAEKLMESMRKQLAVKFGVTVVGPYLTLRFYEGKHLVQVSMQVTSLTSTGVVEKPDDEDK